MEEAVEVVGIAGLDPVGKHQYLRRSRGREGEGKPRIWRWPLGGGELIPRVENESDSGGCITNGNSSLSSRVNGENDVGSKIKHSNI